MAKVYVPLDKDMTDIEVVAAVRSAQRRLRDLEEQVGVGEPDNEQRDEGQPAP